MTSKLVKVDNNYVITSQYLALAGDMKQVTEAISANQQGRPVEQSGLDVITVPTGGGVFWTVENLLGPQAMGVLKGIIIAYTTPRGYWNIDIADSEGDQRPVCASEDGWTGVGDPGGDCQTCNLSEYRVEWFDDNGKRHTGSPCKQRWILWLLQRDSFIPVLVQLPYTSLTVMSKFFNRLTAKGLPYYSVEFEIGLETTKQAGGGLDYSRIVPKIVDQLTPEEIETVLAYKHLILPEA